MELLIDELVHMWNSRIRKHFRLKDGKKGKETISCPVRLWWKPGLDPPVWRVLLPDRIPFPLPFTILWTVNVTNG